MVVDLFICFSDPFSFRSSNRICEYTCQFFQFLLKLFTTELQRNISKDDKHKGKFTFIGKLFFLKISGHLTIYDMIQEIALQHKSFNW